MTRSSALVLRLPAAADAALRDELVALMMDHQLLAIHEDDVAASRTWVAHFANPAARDAALAAVREWPEAHGVRLEPVEVDDEDWARRTQADLPAIQVGRLIIAPPWDIPDAIANAPAAGSRNPDPASRIPAPGRVIVIEPSRGFGTGHHESTRLGLVLLQGRDLAGRSVLDVGTGSGVLAIAAAKLGAASVSAIDVDADAVENARENIARNAVDKVVEAHVRDFTNDAALVPADLVTANLTGTLLARHARELATLVRTGGALIVAGFTEDEREIVAEAFAPELALTENAEEHGWWAFVLSRTLP